MSEPTMKEILRLTASDGCGKDMSEPTPINHTPRKSRSIQIGGTTISLACNADAIQGIIDDYLNSRQRELSAARVLLAEEKERAAQAEARAEALRVDAENMRAIFKRILEWDCLSPVARADLLCDLPWLKRLCERALARQNEHGSSIDAAKVTP